MASPLRECSLCGDAMVARRYVMERRGREVSRAVWLCETCDLSGTLPWSEDELVDEQS